ncbi:PucR family transcriptional regulator [Microbispora sp. H10830]|uniref:PucR family transcriptional regulator n=1 Tax=Microbispora sp. H10830 TaxID=2729109 RepID=UPI0016018EC3|nr:PucR family transcriptional regulator [Microbispora sp. H10830]
MPLTLRELLSFEVLREARPEVLAGKGALDRVVRWVHSSEIYEIGPLLTGGELLLTTGLGLAGTDAGARRHYLREIAARGVAGVALELGRTFPETPPELVEEARRQELPFITLHAVVPFIRITEHVNTLIVDYASRRLRVGDSATRALNEALIAGAGVAGVLATGAEVVGAPLMLLSASGALVAAHGVGSDRDAWRAAERAVCESPVTLHGHPWGRLVAGPGSALPADDLAIALERTAVALALAMLRTGSPPSERDRQASALLRDLIEGTAEADPGVRAVMAGLPTGPGHLLVGVAVDALETAAALAVLDRAAHILHTTALRGRVSRLVLGALAVPVAVADAAGAAAQALEEALRRLHTPQLRVAVGHAATGLAELGGSLRDARAALGLRRGARLVTTRALALELELTRHADARHAAELVRRTIGRLVDWDTAHRTDLVGTLEVFLLHGCSATRAAAALHLGRQTFYQRLQRIETLLGHPVTDPGAHAALLLATAAHRVAGADVR